MSEDQQAQNNNQDLNQELVSLESYTPSEFEQVEVPAEVIANKEEYVDES